MQSSHGRRQSSSKPSRPLLDLGGAVLLAKRLTDEADRKVIMHVTHTTEAASFPKWMRYR